jgi:hypothetical protein
METKKAMADILPGRSNRRRREAGGILLAALIITLLSATIVMTAAQNSSLRMSSAFSLADSREALVYAQMGLDVAAVYLVNHEKFRKGGMPSTVFDKVQYENAVIDVDASDPIDGTLRTVGAGADGSADTDAIRLVSSATVGDFTRTIQTDYFPLPEEALKFVVFSLDEVTLNGGSLEGKIGANGDVDMPSPCDLYGNILQLIGNSVHEDLPDINTSVSYVADAMPFPPSDRIDWYKNNGTRITRRDWYFETRFTSTFAPGVAAKDLGEIYYIDCGGRDLYLLKCYINACLVILNADTVYLGESGFEYEYYHTSPDPGRLPALLVEGDIEMYISGGIVPDAITGCGDVESGIRGLVYATEDISGPQISTTGAITVEGCFIGDDIDIHCDDDTVMKHDYQLNTSLIPEFVKPVMVADPTTYVEL